MPSDPDIDSTAGPVCPGPVYRGPLPPGNTVERAPVTVYDAAGEASRAVAREIADLVAARAAAGRQVVLGLATGSTPVGVYRELVRLHREEGLSFRNVATFNLDEYWPLSPDAPQSYHRFMREQLFDHIDIEPAAVHIPDGTVTRASLLDACARYEERIRAAGGIDLQLLGIGRRQALGAGNAGIEQQGRFGGLQIHLHHQPGLASQLDQPGLTGPAPGADAAQACVFEPGQLGPTLDASFP